MGILFNTILAEQKANAKTSGVDPCYQDLYESLVFRNHRRGLGGWGSGVRERGGGG